MNHREFLAEADDILAQRGESYGGVEESFTRAAQLATLKLNKPVTAYDVATIMESVKDARLAVNPDHWDSHVDGINYRAFRGEFSGAVKGEQTTAVAQEPVLSAATTKDAAEALRATVTLAWRRERAPDGAIKHPSWDNTAQAAPAVYDFASIAESAVEQAVSGPAPVLDAASRMRG
jgi:hypothetical protein